jgi:hypothetical protein
MKNKKLYFNILSKEKHIFLNDVVSKDLVYLSKDDYRFKEKGMLWIKLSDFVNLNQSDLFDYLVKLEKKYKSLTLDDFDLIKKNIKKINNIFNR